MTTFRSFSDPLPLLHEDTVALLSTADHQSCVEHVETLRNALRDFTQDVPPAWFDTIFLPTMLTLYQTLYKHLATPAEAAETDTERVHIIEHEDFGNLMHHLSVTIGIARINAAEQRSLPVEQARKWAKRFDVARDILLNNAYTVLP